MHYEIIPLSKEKWKGTGVPIRFTTDACYDPERRERAEHKGVHLLWEPSERS